MPGAGSDLHVAHIQSPMKMHWLHTTPATYSRRKVWSAASAQLLHDPAALAASVGEAEGAALQGSFHTLSPSGTVDPGTVGHISPLRFMASECLGLAHSRPSALKKDPPRDAPQGTVIRKLEVTQAFREASLAPCSRSSSKSRRGRAQGQWGQQSECKEPLKSPAAPRPQPQGCSLPTLPQACS